MSEPLLPLRADLSRASKPLSEVNRLGGLSLGGGRGGGNLGLGRPRTAIKVGVGGVRCVIVLTGGGCGGGQVKFQGEIDDHAYQLGRWISNLSSSLLPAEVLLDHDGLPPGC